MKTLEKRVLIVIATCDTSVGVTTTNIVYELVYINYNIIYTS